MPVRIIFRGLILLKVEEGKLITARLIDAPKAIHASMQHHPNSPSHEHTGQIQSFTGQPDGGPKPLDLDDQIRPLDRDGQIRTLDPDEQIHLEIPGEPDVAKAESYDKYCPSLPKIANAAGLKRVGGPNLEYVKQTVTVNRGIIRARDVVSWDAGGGEQREPDGINLPAAVTFFGTTVTGYAASECVIDVENADSVLVHHFKKGSTEPYLIETKVAQKISNLDVPPGTVEILITNFTHQRQALPWSLHYRWMFEAAGYLAKPLGSLDELREIARRIGEKAQEDLKLDIAAFVADGETLPFPYFDPATALPCRGGVNSGSAGVAAAKAADPWDRPLCPLGDCGKLTGC